MRSKMIQVKCDKCGTLFVMTSDNIKVQLCEIKEQKFQVMYFACPDCSAVSKVAIKDGDCVRLTKEIAGFEERIAKVSKSDKRKAKMLTERLTKKRIRLGNRIDRLNNKFNGEFELSNGNLIYHE